MAEQLQVFLNQQALGIIAFQGREDRYDLEYAPSWLTGPGFAVSPHLQPGGCHSEPLKRFLANLLPEGKWLEELAGDQHISKNNIFGLVAALGEETTGALSFCLNAPAIPAGQSAFRPVSRQELEERIGRRQEISIARWDGKPRLSVAGVQDKLPLLIRKNGEMGFGEGDLASSHILKFGMRPEMHLVVNEYLCMELARLVKLPVARVALVRFGEPVLVVTRFDRRPEADRVQRLHLIDGCQLLDLPPTYKYERPFGASGEAAKIRTGASLSQLFAACRHCRIPAMAVRDLLNWTLFQLIIGNNDAHAKNISFYVGPRGIDVAPAYDLLNIEIYGGQYDRELAMAVGDAFQGTDVFAYQLAEMCEECVLPQRQVAASLKALCKIMLKGLEPGPPAEILTEEEFVFARGLFDSINANAVRFLGMAAELPHIRL